MSISVVGADTPPVTLAELTAELEISLLYLAGDAADQSPPGSELLKTAAALVHEAAALLRGEGTNMRRAAELSVVNR